MWQATDQDSNRAQRPVPEPYFSGGVSQLRRRTKEDLRPWGSSHGPSRSPETSVEDHQNRRSGPRQASVVASLVTGSLMSSQGAAPAMLFYLHANSSAHFFLAKCRYRSLIVADRNWIGIDWS